MNRVKNFLENIIPCILIVVMMFLLFLNNTKENLWYPEILSLNYSRLNTTELIRSMNPGTPPLYYIIIKTVIRLSGSSPSVPRFFSAFCTCLLALILFLSVKKMFNSKMAYTACIFFLWNPITISNAREITCYSFAALIFYCALISFYFALQAKTCKYWVFYGFFLQAGLYTHYTAFYIIFITSTCLVIYIKWKKTGKGDHTGKSLRCYLVTTAIVLLFFLPLIPGLLKNMKFLPLFSSHDLPGIDIPFNIVAYLFSSKFGYSLVPVIPASYMALFLLIIIFFNTYPQIRHRVDLYKYCWMLAGIIIPVVLTLLFSLLFFPVIHYRNFFLFFPFLILLLARSFHLMKNEYLKVLLQVLLLLILGLIIYQTCTLPQNGPGDAMVEYMQEHSNSNEPVIAGDKVSFLPLYHFLPGNENIYLYSRYKLPDNIFFHGTDKTMTEINALIMKSDSFWLVCTPWNDDILFDALECTIPEFELLTPEKIFYSKWSWIRFKVLHFIKK